MYTSQIKARKIGFASWVFARKNNAYMVVCVCEFVFSFVLLQWFMNFKGTCLLLLFDLPVLYWFVFLYLLKYLLITLSEFSHCCDSWHMIVYDNFSLFTLCASLHLTTVKTNSQSLMLLVLSLCAEKNQQTSAIVKIANIQILKERYS